MSRPLNEVWADLVSVAPYIMPRLSLFGCPRCRSRKVSKHLGTDLCRRCHREVESIELSIAMATLIARCSKCGLDLPAAAFVRSATVRPKSPNTAKRALAKVAKRPVCKDCRPLPIIRRSHGRRFPEGAQSCSHPACQDSVFQQVRRLHPEPECYLCGRKLRWQSRAGQVSVVEVEHVHPVSRGGLHCIDNVLPACHPCNSNKGSRPLAALRPDLAHLDRCCYVGDVT